MNTVLIIPLLLASSLLNPEYVTCKLAKRFEVQGVKQCLYVSANNGVGIHYPTHSFRECPTTYKCPYLPAADKRPTINEILNGLKQGFE